ncbi:MAG: hypothetical protein HC880_14320, partial [Bacteroidia bacterium]|nr:hypothetical protein [Bacteroidia bacterium]
MPNHHFFILFLFLFPFWLIAQETPDSAYQETIQQLQIRLIRGEKQALRDLGSLLDEDHVVEIRVNHQSQRNRLGSLVLGLMQSYTLFHPDELVLNDSLSAQAFLQFFYNRQNDLYFHEPTARFLISSPEKQVFGYELKKYRPASTKDEILAYYQRQIQEELALKRYHELDTWIGQLSLLGTDAAYQFLLECIRLSLEPEPALAAQTDWYRSLLLALRHYPRQASLDLLLNMAHNPAFARLDVEAWNTVFGYVTNHQLNLRDKNPS